MSVQEHGWLVCAPGDPNERQTDAMLTLSGPDHYCAERWNADTGAVRFVVYHDHRTMEYSVDVAGEVRVIGVCR
jgi:hypothetical protein